jgi:fructokinase
MTGGILVIGENVADAVVSSMVENSQEVRMRVFPGGGPANTAVALGRLGVPTSFAGRISTGVLGELFVRRLTDSGVDISRSPRAREPATMAIASLNSLGEAEYDFYATRTADWQWRPAEVSMLKINDHGCVHTGSLALAIQPGADLIDEFLVQRRGSATISIDPNVRTAIVPSERYRERLSKWCSVADIIRLSDVDLEAILPGERPEDIFDDWHSRGVSLVIVTRGPASTLASYRGSRLEVTTAPVESPDTIGAGDAFTAGLLHWLYVSGNLGGRLEISDAADVGRALSYATHIAALTCSVPGANPPWAGEISKEILQMLPSQ